MTDDEIMQGKVAWEIQEKEYGTDFCNKIKDAVNTFGAEVYFVMMNVPKSIDEKVSNLMLLSLKYIEYISKQNAPNN